MTSSLQTKKTEKTDQPFILCLVFFAVIYLALRLLAGLAGIYFSQEYDLNIPILSFTIIITSYLLAKKVHRYLTKIEIVVFSLGAFAIVLVIRLGAILSLTQNFALITSWKIWSFFLIDFIFLLIFFWQFPNRFFKNIEAAEKKTYEKRKKWKVTILLSVLIVLT